MFFEDLRSERQLMRVVADRLSVRWYLGYDLPRATPGSLKSHPYSRALWARCLSPLLRANSGDVLRSGVDAR
jgi:hypothetical protein